MATAVLQKPEEVAQKCEEQTGSWSGIFPTEQVTAFQSALFVKKLLAVAVSNIAYLRAIFPEDAFRDRSLEGLNLKILKDDKSCPGAMQVIKWVKGCFDAFDKKYLRMLMIGLYKDPEDPDTVIESYSFKFSYADEGGLEIYRNNEKISGAHSETEIRKATIRLLRTIILLTQTLDSLPDNVMMTMKLLYYDEDTPEDYEPPGFKASEDDNFVFEDEPMTIKVGDVNTVHHSLKVRVKTDRKQFEMKNSQEGELTEDIASQETELEASQHTEIDVGLDKDVNMEPIDQCAPPKSIPGSGKLEKHSLQLKSPIVDVDIPTESPAKPVEMAVDALCSEASQVTDAGEEFNVRCPCGCNEDDGLMIFCAVCKYWQHGVCFLIMDEEEAPAHHVCDLCAQVAVPDKQPTDFYLAQLSTLQVQATCLWRRTLHSCLNLDRILAHTLATRLGTEVTVAQGLINRLNKEGFLKPPTKPKKLGRVVDKKKIREEGFPKYMVKCEQAVTADISQQQMSQSPVQVEEEEETQPPEDKEVDKLTEKAEKLKINNRKNKLSRKKKNNKDEKTSEEKSDITLNRIKTPVENVQKKEEKRRGRKRAYSRHNEEQEFDISNTQDVYQDEHNKRKRKSSVPRNSILV